MNEDICKLLDELSFLSRETNGASFLISHIKEDGRWKVVFNNAMKHSRNRLKATDFVQAIKDGIEFLKSERKPISIPEEKYTLYNR